MIALEFNMLLNDGTETKQENLIATSLFKSIMRKNKIENDFFRKRGSILFYCR
jgi:hypothetical protein